MKRMACILAIGVIAHEPPLFAQDPQAPTFEIGLVEKTAKGPTNVRVQPLEISIKAALTGQRPELVPVTTTWPLNPDTIGVRAIVRDRFTGRYGTLDLPLIGR